MKQSITIPRVLAAECADALIAKHNAIPADEAHDNVILISFRSLYKELVALDMSFKIASARKPINARNLPLFV